MLNWKLLGDLLPSELKLECERAEIEVSPKGSHNMIKLSKYILSNGYDPETFFFNTHYQADKTHPLLGMTSAVTGPAKMYNAHARVSSSAAVTTSTTSAARPIASAPLMHNNPGLSSTSQTLRSDDKLLEMFERMSLGVEKMVALLEAKKGDSLGVDRSSPNVPCWDSPESDCSFGSSERSSFTSSKYSSVGNSLGRRYDKSLLIKHRICLPFQHGNCPDQYEDHHTNDYGQEVLHCCGLCWTDSPENQCYNPASECPGQFYYC